MEEFTRECLEINSPPPQEQGSDKSPPKEVTGSSMDRVYDHAAKLVQRTLDVEGVFVMDVTHCDVVETMGSEGNVSVALHSGKPGSEMEMHQLTSKDFKDLKEFFTKHPQGKISEGIIPQCFRPYMPTHIRYALSTLHDCLTLEFFRFSSFFTHSCSNIQHRQTSICFTLCIQQQHPHETIRKYWVCWHKSPSLIVFVARRTRAIIPPSDWCYHPICSAEETHDTGRQG